MKEEKAVMVRINESTRKKILRLKKKLQRTAIGTVTQGDAVDVAVSEKLEAK